MPSGRPKKDKGAAEAKRVENGERAFAAASRPAAANSITDLFADYVSDDMQRDMVDIITFCEAEWGLGLGTNPGVPKMLPVQKFVLKAYYGLPLDASENREIVIKDKFNTTIEHIFNEKEFLYWMLDKGYINTDKLTGKRLNLELVIGRRGSKTTVVSFIVCYEFYKLLCLKSPHTYFNIMPDDLIEVTSVSNNEGNSKNMFDRITGNMERSPFFKPYMAGEPNKLDVFFRTRRDIEQYGKSGRSSLKLRAATCSARGLRGPNNFMVLLDEAAFFHKERGSEKSGSNISDTAIYEAVTPSLAMFNNPDGSPAGRCIMISSPDDRTGKVYDEYERSFDEVAGSDLLMINLPTWVMNPLVSGDFLKSKYYANPLTFMCEYGGQFTDRLKGWIDDPEIIRRCVSPGMNYQERSLQRSPFFMGIDIGLKGDGTAIVISTISSVLDGGAMVPKIDVVFAQVRYPQDEKSQSDSGTPYFTPDEMGEWILGFKTRFNIVNGLMDQYYGLAIAPYLERRGMAQVRMEQMSDTRNSELFQNLMSQFVSDKIRLPQGEVDAKSGLRGDSVLVKEVLTLQATQKSKYVVSVEAPQRAGCHDDLSDALARSVWLATKYVEKGLSVLKMMTPGGSMGAGYRSRVQSEMLKIDLKRSVPRMGSRYGGRF